MSAEIKLDHHNRQTAERIFRHPTSHNIQWHDVETRETSHGSLEIKIGDEIDFLKGPRHREVSEDHVVALRKILKRIGLTPEDVEGHGALH